MTGGAIRVLLADDHAVMRAGFRMILDAADGIEVVGDAADGSAAVAAASALRPHVICMDVQMPVMDGYEAARAIRALHRPDAATVPIIAVTANAMTEDRDSGFAAGMNDYLTKPIEPVELRNMLAKWLLRP